MWMFWGIVANLAICFIETVNHTNKAGNWAGTLLWTALPILVCQWALYRLFAGAPTLLVAWIIFTIGNSLFRVLSQSWWMGNPVTPWQIAGISIMIAGAYLVKG